MDAGRQPADDLATRAATVTTAAELAELLRELRRREARERHGRALTYRELVERTGWPLTSVGAYLSGLRVPPTDRFDELIRILGARPHEQGPLATARDRVDDAPRARRIIAGHATASPNGSPTTPARMLPAAPRVFTGRAGALARLDAAATSTGAAGAVVVTAVAGMGGVGTTALAVHWGHSIMERFPGGQLYVNLRGYDPGEPLSTLDALGVLLSGLGAPPQTMPADETGRLILYRNILSGQRALVLLDNARASDQVQPLLPPAPCLALITSRDDLAGLTADSDVRRVRLDVLAEDEAVALLRELIGERAGQQPEAVRTLARRCGYLPLALRVVAELVASRPDVPLLDLVNELEADLETSGLDAFDTGDLRSDLRSVITWSVRCLPDDAARALRLLGILPGNDVDEYVMAALVDVPLSEATSLLTALGKAQLVEPWPPGRYGIHDLVRAYARESAQRDLDIEDRQAAMTRLLDYYLTAAKGAVGTAFPADKPVIDRQRTVQTQDVAVPSLDDLENALAWLNTERANIVAACLHAARHGWPAHVVATATVLWPYLDAAHGHDAISVHTAAIASADDLGAVGDPRDRVRLLAVLALAHHRLGDHDRAAARAEESIATSHAAGDDKGTRLGLTVLASVRSAQGRYPEVVAAFERVVATSRTLGPAAQVVPLVNLGEVNLTLERYEQSEKCFAEAADLAEVAHLRPLGAEAHQGMAMTLLRRGRSADAVRIAERAVETMRSYGYPIRLATMLDTLAQAYRGCGLLAEAIDHLAEAILLCHDIADPALAAQVLNTLGETYCHGGEHALARTSHEEACEFAEQASNRKERARALVGLGDAHAALGDRDRARELWRDALDEYNVMGLPAAARVEARLRDSP